MALTTTQVNQAFLATLGRPAEGSAATWGSTSLSLGALSDSIFIAENTEDFVESLYTEILGRASDAEGKAFWNSLLATTSKEAVLAQFKAAVIAAGQADPSNADYQSFIAQNKAFVATLYANLLGRDDAKTADAEGIDFWANALATGMSRGDLISAFVSAALSDPNSDDAQTLNAKLSVADAFSAAFNDFGKDVTADEKKAALDALKTTMTEVVAGSTVEEFQDAINQFKGQNQDRKTDVFTKAEDDDLDASESTAATTFRGTINISDVKKSTIQAGDAATGNSDFAAANTLIVDVKSDGKEKDFNFGRDMKAAINNVDNLTINNGTADVTLELTGGDNYTGKVAITGKGDRADVTVAQDVASLNVSTSGTKKAYADTTVAANATLGSFEGSAAVDTLKINGIIAKSINTGDGKDEVTLEATSQVAAKATINLGAGDDNIIINTNKIGLIDDKGATIADEDRKANVTIDGGNGKDTLELSTNINYVSSIVNVENIKATDLAAAISAVAADGLKTTVSGALTINADYDNIKSIDLRGIKSEKAASGKADTGSLTVQNVTNENITLSSNIEETIILKGKDATSDNGYAEISKFASGDKIQVSDALLTLGTTNLDGKKVDLTRYNDVKAELAKASANVVAINDTNGKASYIWQKIGTEAKLIAVADKTLKADGANFVLDTTKPAPTPDPKPQANDSVKYKTANDLQGNTTFDLTPNDSGNFTIGDGDKSVQFKAPKESTDTFTFTDVDGNVTLNGSGVAGTVKMYLNATSAITTLSDNTTGTGVTSKVYVGGTAETTSLNKFDISGITLTSIDELFINTTGEVTANSTKLNNTKINFTTDVDAAGAKITFSDELQLGASADATKVENLFATNNTISVVDGNETITFTVAAKASSPADGDKLVATLGKDVITLKAGITTNNSAVIDLGDDTAADKLDAKNVAGAAASTPQNTKLLTVENVKANDVITIALKGSSAVVAASKAYTGNDKQTYDSGNSEHFVTALNKALTAEKGGGSAAEKVYLIETHDTKTSDAQPDAKYLVYDKDANGSISENDIIIKLVGTMTNISINKDTGDVTFA